MIALLGFFGWSWISSEVHPKAETPVVNLTDQDYSTENDTLPAEGLGQPDEDATSDTPGTDQEKRDESRTVPDEDRSAPVDPQEQIDPGSAPEVKHAIQESFESGKPVRWKALGIKGYAVASSASADGCRSVRYSVDGHDLDEFAAVRVCP